MKTAGRRNGWKINLTTQNTAPEILILNSRSLNLLFVTQKIEQKDSNTSDMPFKQKTNKQNKKTVWANANVTWS